MDSTMEAIEEQQRSLDEMTAKIAQMGEAGADVDDLMAEATKAEQAIAKARRAVGMTRWLEAQADGTVIRWTRQFTSGTKSYGYVAIKVGLSWYVSDDQPPIDDLGLGRVLASETVKQVDLATEFRPVSA